MDSLLSCSTTCFLSARIQVGIAADSEPDRPLECGTGGPIFANPVSLLMSGRQHVAISVGNALFASCCRIHQRYNHLLRRIS